MDLRAALSVVAFAATAVLIFHPERDIVVRPPKVMEAGRQQFRRAVQLGQVEEAQKLARDLHYTAKDVLSCISGDGCRRRWMPYALIPNYDDRGWDCEGEDCQNVDPGTPIELALRLDSPNMVRWMFEEFHLNDTQYRANVAWLPYSGGLWSRPERAKELFTMIEPPVVVRIFFLSAPEVYANGLFEWVVARFPLTKDDLLNTPYGLRMFAEWASERPVVLRWLIEELGVSRRDFEASGVNVVTEAFQGDRLETVLYLIERFDLSTLDIADSITGLEVMWIRNADILAWVRKTFGAPIAPGEKASWSNGEPRRSPQTDAKETPSIS